MYPPAVLHVTLLQARQAPAGPGLTGAQAAPTSSQHRKCWQLSVTHQTKWSHHTFTFGTSDFILPNVSSLFLTPMYPGLTPCHDAGCDVPSNWHTAHWPGCTGDLTRSRFLAITHQRPRAPAARVGTTFHVTSHTDTENPYLIGTDTVQLSCIQFFANNIKVVTPPLLVSFLMECGPCLPCLDQPDQANWEWE